MDIGDSLGGTFADQNAVTWSATKMTEPPT
jgi:hypothetical protein